MRYFAVISYDGTDFLGWQKQVEGDQSIQYAIERALSLLLRENIGIVGCGRTDTGVHARGYHLHFDTLQEINEEDLTFRLNRMLPESIAIH